MDDKNCHNSQHIKVFLWYLGQIFLLVDLRDFFSDLGSGDKKK